MAAATAPAPGEAQAGWRATSGASCTQGLQRRNETESGRGRRGSEGKCGQGGEREAPGRDGERPGRGQGGLGCTWGGRPGWGAGQRRGSSSARRPWHFTLVPILQNEEVRPRRLRDLLKVTLLGGGEAPLGALEPARGWGWALSQVTVSLRKLLGAGLASADKQEQRRASRGQAATQGAPARHPGESSCACPSWHPSPFPGQTWEGTAPRKACKD